MCACAGPVVGLGRPDVGGRAQLAPGSLVIGAAAASVAVRLLAERIRHGVGSNRSTHIDTQTQSELNQHNTPVTN